MLEFNATLLAQVVHFLILLIFLRFVAYKPLIKLLSDRQRLIENNINAAEQERQQAGQLKEELESDLRRAREQAQDIIQKAAKAAEDQAVEIIENAKNEAKRLKESALAEIQREKDKAVAEMRDQAASLAVLAAGKILERQIDDKIQHELVREFVKEAGELLC
ncbi:MAG: ATP synthase subunit b, sodium ion specific [Pelotomaculum sp. PtaU1.Bin035]|nr:MAG: ATP synthase subunit b, sodium ion specific [Pelotomaculum sp. PtaU1.Bin035]